MSRHTSDPLNVDNPLCRCSACPDPFLDSLVTHSTLLREGLLSAGCLHRFFNVTHGPKIQPIVANGQQLIRATLPNAMQPMVVLTKQQCRDGFAKRLLSAFERLSDFPKVGRPAWISKRYKKEISGESARKWLDAESIPDMGHLAMLCTDLGVHPSWLLTNLGPMLIEGADDNAWPFEFSIKRYKDLTEGQRVAVAGVLLGAIIDFEQGSKKNSSNNGTDG